ncbi:MAG TPA: hypothetical protein VMZ50_02730, partial [Phycisphaerae bacterium]|nr:hypothetical protein [Phycisphaerae bacterium]
MANNNSKKNEVILAEVMPMADPGDPRRVRWMLARAKTLVEVASRTYIELGKVLAEIAREGYYRHEKDKKGQEYATFEQYAEDCLGVKGRKARYLISINERLVEGAGVQQEMLQRIGWSNASQVARLPQEVLDDPKKVEKWIAKAEKTKHRDLEAEVNDERNKVAEAKGETSTLRAETLRRETFWLFEAQHQNVVEALKLAGRLTGSEKRGHWLDCMATDFLAGRVDEGAAKLTHILKACERVFQCKIVAV